MIFVVAGVPADLFGRFQQLAKKVFGEGHLVIAKPIRARPDGKFAPDMAYGQRLVSDLANRIILSPEIARDGCGVILLASPNLDIRDCAQCFEPFALSVALDLPIPTLTIGHAGSRTMNAIAEKVRSAAVTLRRGVKAMNSEISSRKNRTPLLLPIRNFSSDVLTAEISSLHFSLASADAPAERIRAACMRIEQSHPFTKPGGGSFYDRRGVRFKVPGRALHGSKATVGDGHLPSCLLNSRLRLGGHSDAGFHYDCTQGSNGVLSGAFPNCHGACREYAGHPHLNIYPNDFLR